MSEFSTLYQVTGAGIALVISSFFYSWGGRAGGPGKWARRFLGSFILAATVWALCLIRGNFNWWLLTIYIPIMAGYTLPYGANTLGGKLAKRTVYALAVLVSGVICAYFLGAWLVLIPHVGVALWSIWLGVKNPVDATAEEFFVSMLLNLGLIMYPFI